MFKIDVDHLSWIKGNPDDPEDLCAHGHAVAQIGGEMFEYDATVSAAALYLLKSLSENHIIYEEEQRCAPHTPALLSYGCTALFRARQLRIPPGGLSL